MADYNLPNGYTFENDEMNYYWTIFYGNKKMGEFSYMEEDGRWWLSGCSIDEEHQRQGIGSSMISKAVDYYGEVFFCTADQADLNTFGHGEDSRYLTEEGAALLNSCIRKGIVQKDWAIHPYRNM